MINIAISYGAGTGNIIIAAVASIFVPLRRKTVSDLRYPAVNNCKDVEKRRGFPRGPNMIYISGGLSTSKLGEEQSALQLNRQVMMMLITHQAVEAILSDIICTILR